MKCSKSRQFIIDQKYNELKEDEEKELNEHLGQCDNCRKYKEEVKTVFSLLPPPIELHSPVDWNELESTIHIRQALASEQDDEQTGMSLLFLGLRTAATYILIFGVLLTLVIKAAPKVTFAISQELKPTKLYIPPVKEETRKAMNIQQEELLPTSKKDPPETTETRIVRSSNQQSTTKFVTSTETLTSYTSVSQDFGSSTDFSEAPKGSKSPGFQGGGKEVIEGSGLRQSSSGGYPGLTGGSSVQFSWANNPVSIKREEVSLARLEHDFSNYQIYDGVLDRISKDLDKSFPGKDFVVISVQSVSSCGAPILFMTGEDPKVAKDHGRLPQKASELKTTFDDGEALKTYVANRGTLFVICATPYEGTGEQFYGIVKAELTRIFKDKGEWERIPSGDEIYAPNLEGIKSGARYAILLSKGDLFQSQSSNYFGKVLSYALKASRGINLQ